MIWNLEGGVGVVTGAGSGIGRALANRLAREKMSLALADVDANGLEETVRQLGPLSTVSTHVVDVADPKSVGQFAADVLARHQRVTLLINNAGVGMFGTVEELSIEEIDWLMRINFWGVVYGVKYFLPSLRKEPRAHIVNVSSFQGIVASAGNSAYCASKFAVRGFTEVLQREMESSTIGVSCVHPGTIRTQMSRNSRLSTGVQDPAVFKGRDNYLYRSGRTSPEGAADRIVDGIKRGETRILIGSDAIWSDRLQRMFPSRYADILQLARKLRKTLVK